MDSKINLGLTALLLIFLAPALSWADSSTCITLEYYYMDGCPYCEAQTPVINNLESESICSKTERILIDWNDPETMRDGISAVPTMIASNENGCVKKKQGYTDYDALKSWLNNEEWDCTVSEEVPEETAEEIPVYEEPSSDYQLEHASKVTVVAYFDLQCPYCKRTYNNLKQLKNEFGDNLEIEIKHFPLVFHQDSQKAAEATECARDQGMFDEYLDKLFENSMNLRVDSLKQYASELGLDEAEFSQCLDNNEKTELIESSVEEAEAIGIGATPTLFFNGFKLVGAKATNSESLQEYRSIITKILEGEESESADEEAETAWEVVEEKPEETEAGTEESECEGSACDGSIEENDIYLDDLEYVSNARCTEGQTENYVCPNGTEISWCKCLGGEWQCILSPESGCVREPECEGCFYNENCLATGTRIESDGTSYFCSYTKEMKEQRSDESSCQNNYECQSNQCSNKKCINIQQELEEQRSLLEKIWQWLLNLFSW